MDLTAARHAFITGGASGIGLGIAGALADHGISVTIADINQESLDTVIGSRGSGFLGVALDVRDRAGWAAAKTKSEAMFGPVDILVNNAGIGFNGCDVVDMDPETFDMLIAIDLTGVFNGIATFGPDMRARGGAHIVNTASVLGLASGAPGRGAYSAAKSAVTALSEALRAEMAPHGVGVSVLCPGLVKSNLDRNTSSLGGQVADAGHVKGTGNRAMDPATAGDHVARGIAQNLPYIITHPHYLDTIESRMNAIRASAAMTSAPRASHDDSRSGRRRNGGDGSRPAVGLHYGGTDQSMPLVELALAAELRGFDSLFLPEHSHIPSARRSPFPGGGEMPDRYFRLWDPLVALAQVAATTDLIIGTCVALPGGHDPISYAKAVATLDVMSGGRFVMGVGFGWNNDEFEDHGFAAEAKYAVVTEKIALMKTLWTAEEASYSGDHVRLSPSRVWPKPLQNPHPPILLGSRASRVNFRRIAEWGDGWIPMGNDVVETLGTQLPQLHSAWNEAGRDPADLQVVVLQKIRPGIGEVLDRLGDLGVQRVLIDIPTAPASTILPLLDEVAGEAAMKPRQ